MCRLANVLLKGGQVLYKGPAVRWKRESCGTTVCVRDAFYNVRSFNTTLANF